MSKEKINANTTDNNQKVTNIRVEFHFNMENDTDEIEISRCIIAALFAQENINCIGSSKEYLIFEDSKNKYLDIFVALSDLRYDELVIKNLRESYIWFDDKEDLLHKFLRKNSPYEFSIDDILM